MRYRVGVSDGTSNPAKGWARGQRVMCGNVRSTQPLSRTSGRRINFPRKADEASMQLHLYTSVLTLKYPGLQLVIAWGIYPLHWDQGDRHPGNILANDNTEITLVSKPEKMSP